MCAFRTPSESAGGKAAELDLVIACMANVAIRLSPNSRYDSYKDVFLERHVQYLPYHSLENDRHIYCQCYGFPPLQNKGQLHPNKSLESPPRLEKDWSVIAYNFRYFAYN